MESPHQPSATTNPSNLLRPKRQIAGQSGISSLTDLAYLELLRVAQFLPVSDGGEHSLTLARRHNVSTATSLSAQNPMYVQGTSESTTAYGGKDV